jgi:hypothetical protein
MKFRHVHLFSINVYPPHNACIRELLQEVNVHGKADRHMRLLRIETENRLGTLWDQEECRESSIKKDPDGEDWMELDWTRQLKSS